MSISSLKEQAGLRWTLNRQTKCNITAYLRPCQTCPSAGSGNHPLDDICAAGEEVIYVVDDEQDQREALAEAIASAGYEVQCAENANQLQDMMLQRRPACIVLDIRLRGRSGIEFQEWARANRVITPIIMISGLNDREVIVEAMKNGAVDFLVKPVSELSLRKSVNAAIGFYRQRNCIAESRKLILEALDQLTETERKIAGMIANGLSTKMIAAELDRSESTIKIHKHRIMTKLKITSVASIAHLLTYVGGADA